MQYKQLGTTGMDVSVLSYGTSPLGDMFGTADDSIGAATVRRALDSGINLFDSSPFYGNGVAEERLGRALGSRRAEVFVTSKAGRYSDGTFDYSPARIRSSVEQSLRLLQTDHLDVLFLHDIEFVALDPVLTESYGELVSLRDAGKTRFIGMSGYPMATMRRVVTETDVDVVLTYSHATLLDNCLGERLLPIAEENGVGVINAAAVALGLLTPSGSKIGGITHPADSEIQAVAAKIVELCAARGSNVSDLANQFSIQRSGAATTMIGTVNPRHLDAAIAAVDAPIDEELLAEVLAISAPIRARCWSNGLPENN